MVSHINPVCVCWLLLLLVRERRESVVLSWVRRLCCSNITVMYSSCVIYWGKALLTRSLQSYSGGSSFSRWGFYLIRKSPWNRENFGSVLCWVGDAEYFTLVLPKSTTDGVIQLRHIITTLLYSNSSSFGVYVSSHKVTWSLSVSGC